MHKFGQRLLMPIHSHYDYAYRYYYAILRQCDVKQH